MEKKTNVVSLLIYPENLAFLKHEVKLPYSSNEIMGNLRRRMGGVSAFEKNPFQGIALYGGLLILCAVMWFLIGFSVADYFINFSGSTGPIPGPKSFSRMLIFFAILLGPFTWVIASTLFRALWYSPEKMRKSYAVLLQQGKLIRGTVISEAAVNGDYLITYEFSSPANKVIEGTYKSSRRHFKKAERGRNVAVWYLSDSINTLL